MIQGKLLLILETHWEYGSYCFKCRSLVGNRHFSVPCENVTLGHEWTVKLQINLPIGHVWLKSSLFVDFIFTHWFYKQMTKALFILPEYLSKLGSQLLAYALKTCCKLWKVGLIQQTTNWYFLIFPRKQDLIYGAYVSIWDNLHEMSNPVS